MNFSPNDFIFINSWQQLVSEIGGKLVYRNTEQVPDFFKEIKGTDKKVILVSGSCDYTVCEQEKHHPNADLMKLSASVNWPIFDGIKDQYCHVQVGPAIVPEKCINSHKYSLKTERFTWETFEEVPDEVEHWYTTNLNCIHPKISLLPFGLNTDGDGKDFIKFFMDKTKRKPLYINFQDNTLDRVRLKIHYSSPAYSWVTFIPQANLPVSEYLEQMSYHHFTLNPEGNGVDNYRTMEAIYLGSIPIMQTSDFTTQLQSILPILVYDNLSILTPELLKSEPPLNEFESCKLGYWKNKFTELSK